MVTHLNLTTGSISRTILLSLSDSPKPNKELCIACYDEVTQNHRTSVNRALQDLRRAYMVENINGVWYLDKVNGKYIVKVIKNLRERE